MTTYPPYVNIEDIPTESQMTHPKVQDLRQYQIDIETQKAILNNNYQQAEKEVIEELAAFKIGDPVVYEKSSTVYYVKSRAVDFFSEEGIRYSLSYAKKDGSPSNIVAIYFALQNQLKHA